MRDEDGLGVLEMGATGHDCIARALSLHDDGVEEGHGSVLRTQVQHIGQTGLAAQHLGAAVLPQGPEAAGLPPDLPLTRALGNGQTQVRLIHSASKSPIRPR